MSNADWNQQLRYADEPESVAGCQANDLKGLLNTIVEQLSDADRRHTETLHQMQDRLAGLGRETQSLRGRVPDQFAGAFERIEAGMSELASRIADMEAAKPDQPGQHSQPAPQAMFAPEPMAAYTAHPAATAELAQPAAAPTPAPVPAAEPVAAEPEVFAPAASARGHDEPVMRSQHAHTDTDIDAPVALRSASDAMGRAPKRHEISNVDPFDVIESSVPGNVSDPWDRDAAEALTGLYETGAANFGPATEPAVSEPRAFMAQPAFAPVASVPTGAIDHSWLESRFTEIANRIDQSLADIRPDKAFFAMGQRIDQIETHISALSDTAATRADVEGIRLIEAHVGEVAGQLERAQTQLARLDVIETQLTDIAAKLADVHEAAMQAEAPSAAQAVTVAPISEQDLQTVARTAAQEAANRFADLRPRADQAQEQIRPLIDQMMSEQRQADENTSALLDTLQQAMIRLLDRIDAIEFAQHTQAQSAPQEYVREQVRFNVDPRSSHMAAGEPAEALDAAVAAVASAKTMSAPAGAYQDAPLLDQRVAERRVRNQGQSQPQPQADMDDEPAEGARGAGRVRQDFIADARRAKMRLAASAQDEANGDAVVISGAAHSGADDALKADAGKRAGGAVLDAAKVTGASLRGMKPKGAAPALPSPRLMVMGVAALAMLAGVWYFLDPGTGSRLTKALAPASAQKSKTAEGVSRKVDAASAASNGLEPASGEGDAPAQAPKASPASKKGEGALGPRSDVMIDDNGTAGEIIPGEVVVGQTSTPLVGIAVDTEQHVTAADLQRAQRRQAMASMSSQVGQAVAETAAGDAHLEQLAATPAKLVANDPAAQDGAAAAAPSPRSGMSQSLPLDMPPATVGPLSLRLAAANGDPSAAFEVGARLAEGKGMSQNFKEAAKWYQRSADQGFAQAQYRLGTLYERGLGLTADAARAEDWYKRAAEQGNVKAMHNLAVMSANQKGGSPDYATAAQWFQQAAERGLSDSQFNLAVLHENGLGVAQDLKAAYKWLALAARGGDKEAVHRRDILRTKLTADDLAQAEALVKGFKAKPVDPVANDSHTAGEAWKKNPANNVAG